MVENIRQNSWTIFPIMLIVFVCMRLGTEFNGISHNSKTLSFNSPLLSQYSQLQPTGQSTQQYNLTSVFVSRLRRLAIINGRPVAIGDNITGAQIVAIKPRSVQIYKNGETFTVPLKKNI